MFGDKLVAILLGLLLVLAFYAQFLAPVAMVDVEVYRMEDGSYIYCATGSLTDPPATHISFCAMFKESFFIVSSLKQPGCRAIRQSNYPL